MDLTEFATYEKQGRIAIVTINRPERMNALHPPANFELHEIWNDFERDPDVWVGILTGSGDRAFSAGNDLRFTAEHGRDMVRMAESGFGGLANRTTCWKPILAAVNGYVTTLSTEVNQASFPTPLMALPLRATSRALGTAHARGLNLSAFAKPGSTDPVANFLDAHYSAARCQIDTSRSGLDSFARAALQECL